MTPRALVTGAASGIGRAASYRLQREGYDVVAVDRHAPSLAKLEADGMQPLVADLSNPPDRRRVIDEGEGCDALVNSAGVNVLKPILDLTVEDLQGIFRVNVDAVWDLTSHIGRTMPAGSAIVNLSSSAAKLATTTEAAAYAASKAAVLSITRSFAYAFAPHNVRVNALCPGVVDTPMQDDVMAGVAQSRGVSVEQIVAERHSMVPLGRPSSADECAGAIWFLLSTEASYMTGQSINFTGGLVTW